jgi:hypothetical protein
MLLVRLPKLIISRYALTSSTLVMVCITFLSASAIEIFNYSAVLFTGK